MLKHWRAPPPPLSAPAVPFITVSGPLRKVRDTRRLAAGLRNVLFKNFKNKTVVNLIIFVLIKLLDIVQYQKTLKSLRDLF